MKRLYRIGFSPGCPKLAITLPGAGSIVEAFDGQPLASLSPDEPFVGTVERECSWSQLYACGEDAVAFTDAAWESSEDMYYVFSIGGCEILGAQAGDTWFSIINALDFAPRARTAAEPFDVSSSFYAPIFRIHDRPRQIFCLEGTPVPGDEFKHAYDTHGFQGLTFQEVWSEADGFR